MRILGIETSCDETAISLIEVDETSKHVRVLGNTVHSQIDIHASYGGVFPTLAKREHQKNLVPVFEKTLREANLLTLQKDRPNISEEIKKILEREPELLKAFEETVLKIENPSIDFISITRGPGLEPALWVGIGFARALSTLWNVPLVPSNHMEGHILAALIRKSENGYMLAEPKFPALSLLVSGGHTQIVLMKNPGSYEIAGETRDDAIGECFDKVARTLGLAYPGGPKISKLAAEARKEKIESPEKLPRPMIDSGNLDFSFSGLKTAVLYLVRRLAEKGIKMEGDVLKGISREVEDATTDVVVSKMRQAIEKFGIETIIVGGGVIANTNLRAHLEKLASAVDIPLLLPQIDHSTDNGLMIALTGFVHRLDSIAPGALISAAGTLPLGPKANFEKKA